MNFLGTLCPCLPLESFSLMDDDAAPVLARTGFDPKTRGESVRVVGDVVSGTGCVLGRDALDQDRAYWEVKVVSHGPFSVGVVNRSGSLPSSIGGGAPDTWGCALNTGGDDEEEEMNENSLLPDDVLGCAFDQSSGAPTLRFYKNGT